MFDTITKSLLNMLFDYSCQCVGKKGTTTGPRWSNAGSGCGSDIGYY